MIEYNHHGPVDSLWISQADSKLVIITEDDKENQHMVFLNWNDVEEVIEVLQGINSDILDWEEDEDAGEHHCLCFNCKLKIRKYSSHCPNCKVKQPVLYKG